MIQVSSFRRLLVACMALLAFGAAPAPPAAPSGLAATARRLQGIHPEEERDVPPEARSLLTVWKRQIRELVTRELNGGSYQTAPAERIRADLKAALGREGVPVEEEQSRTAGDGGPYGWVTGVDVQRPTGHDRLLAVTVTQGISCGSDTSLYLFQRDGERWRLAFALESNDYEKVSGGLGSFDFGVSPPDKQGGFFIVATDVNPWCSSSWQGFHYRAYRVGGDPLRPVPFFTENGGIFDWEYKLAVEADRFRVTFQGSQSLDTGILVRDHVGAYRVTGNKAERIGPLASEPRGFIDEWIAQPWKVAQRWASRSRRASLKSWHDRLKKRLKNGYSEFDSLETCGPSRWQAMLELHPDKKAVGPPPVIYFSILRRGDDFEMEKIGEIGREGCVEAP
ncbi:MAG TPA: hypothetical protein VF173_08835 [Thermoanaerobaculia bacterium]|nr:hypothetical protein [Thermoanaerobaculia bacterium]